MADGGNIGATAHGAGTRAKAAAPDSHAPAATRCRSGRQDDETDTPASRRASARYVRVGTAIFRLETGLAPCLRLFDAMTTIKSSLKRRGAATRRALDSLRVLVIEDQRDLRELFAELLAEEGAAVTQVGTGREAIALSSIRRFDVVLTDLGLPDISGDLLVRELLAAAKPLVVVITGQGEPHLGRARAAGAHAVFQKPVEWHRIVTYLRHSSAAKPG